jgi:replicative DNA helicase
VTIERHFLGKCLWDPSILLSTRLVPSDFQGEQERVLFMAMLGISKEGGMVDEVSLSQRAGLSITEVMSMKDTNILTSNWRFSEQQMKNAVGINKVKQVAEDILHSKGMSVGEYLVMMQSIIDEFATEQDGFTIATVEQVVMDTMKTINERVKNGGGLVGIPSGVQGLDNMTLGFQARRLYYIGARPSQGKTALLLNFIANCTEKCGVISAESGKEELCTRLLARGSRIDSQRLTSGKGVYEGELKRVNDTASRLYDHAGIFVYDEPNMSIDTAVAMARQMKRKYDIQILFVDYLQCLNPSRDGSKREYREQVAYASKQMKQLARTLNIPVVVAAQLRRDAEGNRPVLSDFSDSTQIERDADVAIMIHSVVAKRAEGPARGEENEETYLLVEKNRDGGTGDVQVVFTKPHVLFADKRL